MTDHDHLLRSLAWWALWVTVAALVAGIGLALPYQDSVVAEIVGDRRQLIAVALLAASGVMLLVAVFALVDGLQGLTRQQDRR